MTIEIGDVVPSVELLDSRGRPVRIDEFIDRPTIVQCLRYYG